jgi:hypothetical protein
LKWIAKDVEQYLKAQEYIDTAVIPLIPVAFGAGMKQAAAMSEFTTLVSALLEKQFTGRILMLPPFTYLNDGDKNKRHGELAEWVTASKANQVKHLFLLTCDSEWKVYEDQLKESLIWFPAIPLENLEDSQKYSIVESQVEQLFAIFSRKWQEFA